MGVILKGTMSTIFIEHRIASMLINRKFHWVGHTHPGDTSNCLLPSDGDYMVLRAFGQKRSMIYNSVGKFFVFEEDSI